MSRQARPPGSQPAGSEMQTPSGAVIRNTQASRQFLLATWRERAIAIYRALSERRRTPAEWAYLILWICYLFSYPFAVIGVAFNVHAGFSMAWAGSVLLFVQGALAVLWLVLSLGARRGGMLALLVALGAFLGETWGVASGVPFGPYSYTTILFPRLPGSVPLPVIGAWLLVTATTVGIARLITPRMAKTMRLFLLVMALGVALDLVLEPVAVIIEHYWVWHASGPYYGIPLTNFVGWAELCIALAGVVLLGWNRAPPSSARARQARSPTARKGSSSEPGGLPLGGRADAGFPIPSVAESMLWLYALTMAMFAVIDLTHGLWVAAFVGMATLVALALWARRNV
jgi:putative membrane protein